MTTATKASVPVLERVPIARLTFDPENARLHPEENLAAIQGSMRRFGQQTPLVAQRDGRVVVGNGRLEAAKRLGWTEVMVLYTDLVGAEARAYAIADNQSALLASWDKTALAAAMASFDLEMRADLGFNEDQIRAMAGCGDGVQVADAPERMDVATSRIGDTWILGRHRLRNGNSASVEDVDILLAGAPIHLVNMDPPYNVKVEPRSNNAIAAGLSSFAPQKQGVHKDGLRNNQHFDATRQDKSRVSKMRAKDRPLANDFITPEAFDDALKNWFGNASRVLLPGRGFYIWGGYANCANYPGALVNAGLYFSQAIIWVKEHPVLTRKDFMGNHKWCFYGWKEGAAHEFFGPNNAPDVWSIKKLTHTKMVHLTEKPVELATRAMEYSSRTGENVLDLFGGSGSTMMGGELTNRNVYSMELDGPYCDVIINRWQNTTGKQAILESNGKTFAEMVKERAE